MSQVTGIFGDLPRPDLSTLRRWKVRAQSLWVAALPRTRTSIQMAALLGVVIIAYSYSLTTLFQLADLNTPLAYVSLVPLISLILAAMNSQPRHPEPLIYDRQTDYIIGVPLMGAALLVNRLLPAKLSAMFWVWRIDLLTLPFFVAGAVAVVFGVRVLWRQKFAVGFLILAWPYPYTTVLLSVLNAFTSATLFAMARIVKVTHVATLVGPLNGGVFSVVHHGHTFSLSVVSACSGVSSVVGFLLVGTAFAATVRGALLRKVVWLAGGMVLLWAINLGRITLIFWSGQQAGEHFAIDILHPFIGLVTFGIGVALMILCIKPLGLRLDVGRNRSIGAELDPLAAHVKKPQHAVAVPKVYLAVSIVLVLATLVGFSNIELQSYNLVANVAGESKLASYQTSPVAPAGWTSRYETTFSWAEPLFGDGSTWNRYELFPEKGGGDLHATTEVVADVIDTPELETFSAYGVEQCYEFHGYSLANVAQIALGGGVTGQALSYNSPQFGSWSIVYWIVPVKRGSATVYERVVLYVQNQHGIIAPATEGQQSGIKTIAGPLGSDNAQQLVLLQNRDFLVAYARQLIRVQASKGAKILSHSSLA